MVVAPRRVRAGQVVQVFSTILRMEYGKERRINVRVSITEGTTELASTEVLFDRPSSRLMQLMVGIIQTIANRNNSYGFVVLSVNLNVSHCR